MEGKRVNILVADDSRIFCESLAALLEKAVANRVYKAYQGKEALGIANQYRIDVALLDVRMPIMDGLHAAERILKEHVHVKVIGMTSFDEEATLLDLLRVGVHGILLKRSTHLAELTLAIDEVIAGRKYFNEEIRHVINNKLNLLAASSSTRFTHRELEVLHLTSKGKVAKEIADVLQLSTSTIEDYRKEMLRKTKSRNVAELISFALRNGIL